MSVTINLAEKFAPELADYFAYKSVTEHAFDHNIDAEFTGVDTVHIYQTATSDLNDYNKRANPAGQSRFGTPIDVGDYCYTFSGLEDKSLDLTIDRGDNDAQLNIKKVGSVMKAYTDEQIRPYKDKYRLGKWCKEAGIHMPLSAAPDKSSIVSAILDLHNSMVEENVPQDCGTLYIPREYLKQLRLADEWVKLDSLGGKSLPSGVIGIFDGLNVQPVSSKMFPAGCYFAIFVKESIVAPEKICFFRGIKDSENVDGDRIQWRNKFGAFVMPSKAAGAAVACASDSVTATPTVSVSGGKATVSAASGAVVYYTTDGSDPRYPSKNRKTYSTAVTVVPGDVFRSCAQMDGKFMSAATINKVTG